MLFISDVELSEMVHVVERLCAEREQEREETNREKQRVQIEKAELQKRLEEEEKKREAERAKEREREKQREREREKEVARERERERTKLAAKNREDLEREERERERQREREALETARKAAEQKCEAARDGEGKAKAELAQVMAQRVVPLEALVEQLKRASIQQQDTIARLQSEIHQHQHEHKRDHEQLQQLAELHKDVARLRGREEAHEAEAAAGQQRERALKEEVQQLQSKLSSSTHESLSKTQALERQHARKLQEMKEEEGRLHKSAQALSNEVVCVRRRDRRAWMCLLCFWGL